MIANSLVLRKTEAAFRDFLISENLPDIGNRVYRYVETQEAASPCIFVMAQTLNERTPGSGRYNVPLTFKICLSEPDFRNDTGSLDRMGGNLESALIGSINSINSAANNIFIFQATKPSGGPEILPTAYQYSVDLMVVCKGL